MSDLREAFEGARQTAREQDEEIARLRVALAEALDGWEYAAEYKSDFLREKHGDAPDIARLRALLPESPDA